VKEVPAIRRITPTRIEEEEKGNVYLLADEGEQKNVWKSLGTTSVDVPINMAGNLGGDVIYPNWNPEKLYNLKQTSVHLQGPIDAYVNNIDGFGHTYVPLVNLADIKTARQSVAEALDFERYLQGDKRSVTNKDVDAILKMLKLQQSREKQFLEYFFSGAYIDGAFVDLRRQTREDRETTGNGYWEVLRTEDNKIAAFNHMSPNATYATNIVNEPVECVTYIRRSILSIEERIIRKQFRRYVQFGNYESVYFKEFGDPRLMSRKTGKFYGSKSAMVKEEGEYLPATEIKHFKIYDPNSVYGTPRWIGALLAVLGSRAAEEINLDYFHSKPPAGLLFVTGGKLTKDVRSKIETLWETKATGKERFHGLIVVEAVTQRSAMFQEASGKVAMEFVPLTGTQNNDALFREYDKTNGDKISHTMRVPRLLRGDTRDFNRACYSEDTETLTESGWKRYDQIGPNEKIAAVDFQTGKITYVIPTQKLVYDVDEKLVHFKSEYSDCLVTKDHKMRVRISYDLKWKEYEANYIKNKLFWRGDFIEMGHAGSVDEISSTEIWDIPELQEFKNGELLTTDKNFANKVQRFLVETGRSSVIESKYIYNGDGSTDEVFLVKWLVVDSTRLYQKDIELISYKGKVYCFSVPGYGYFVTRRNGKVAIQGNTADAAIWFSEMQVFGPERQSFDDFMNGSILPVIGITTWLFQSNGPDPVNLEYANAITNAQRFAPGMLLNNEARERFGTAINAPLPPLDENKEMTEEDTDLEDDDELIETMVESENDEEDVEEEEDE
jgi:PBSX family phage portal protein